ncbi:MAG: beta-ketoacyl-[acyl-carrier-protein] synthase II, partial [bacterium]
LSANGSVLGDRIETLAIGQVFGDLAEKIPVCAIKSKIGECYGASGVFQVAAAVLSMDHDLVPGIANFQEGDADSPLGGVSGQNRLCECNAVLINSFDGRHNNSSLVVKRYSP